MVIFDEHQKIRVLIVDDSAFMRRAISAILDSDSEIQVIGTAKNGVEALEKAHELKPDVITMDLNMPVMDGIECLERIRASLKIPVIMLSSYTKEGAAATMQALSKGATDFIAKPENIFDMKKADLKKEIIDKVKVARYSKFQDSIKREEKIVKIRRRIYRDAPRNLVAIGTSTGGPKALQEIIPLISPKTEAAFMLVQHMPAGFTKSLAERLDAMSAIKVKEAEHDELLKCAHAYIAPGGYHMLVKETDKDVYKIKLTKTPLIEGHRPSVDVMLESVSKIDIDNIVAVIMTGMGKDGSNGIRELKKRRNAHIIAQDEDTCVVFGMPRMAIATGLVDKVVPLGQIADEIMKTVGVHR